MIRKIMGGSFLAVLLFTGGVLAETSSTNTDAVAASESFEIRNYSPKTGVVKIKCGSVSTNRLFSSFSEAEQDEITNWLMDKRFKSMRVTVNKEVTRETYSQSKSKSAQDLDRMQVYYTGETQQIWYEIELENASSVHVEDITVEYRIFYKTRDGQKGGLSYVDKNRVQLGKKQFSLPPQKTGKVKTETVSIRDRGLVTAPPPGYYGGDPTVYDKDRLLGVHVRITRTDRNGDVITLEKEQGKVPPEKEWGEFIP